MAGHTKSAAEVDRLNILLTKQAEEIQSLRQTLAAIDPKLLRGSKAKPFGNVDEKNSAQLGERIIAMAQEGMMESQWVAAMGFTAKQWSADLLRFPNLAADVSRARVQVIAFFEGALSRSITEQNNRFPSNAVQQLIKNQRELLNEDSSAGDSHGLVNVTVPPPEPQKSANPDGSISH